MLYGIIIPELTRIDQASLAFYTLAPAAGKGRGKGRANMIVYHDSDMVKFKIDDKPETIRPLDNISSAIKHDDPDVGALLAAPRLPKASLALQFICLIAEVKYDA